MGQSLLSLLSLLLVGKHKTPEQIQREKAEEKYRLEQEFAEIERKNKIWEEKNAKEEKEELDKLSDEILKVFNNSFNVSQIKRMRHWDRKLRITLNSDIKLDSEDIIKHFKKHKLISNIEFFGNEIFISLSTIDIDQLGEVMWNKIHPVKQVNQPTQTPKVNVSSSVIQNEAKQSENVVNNSNNINTSDIDKQLELLKRQQEILDRQIELERLKQQNRN